MIDPTRPFHGTSGGVHIATDIWTIHNYEQNPEELKSNCIMTVNYLSPQMGNTIDAEKYRFQRPEIYRPIPIPGI